MSYYKILQDAAGNFVGVGLEFGDVSDSRHGEFDQKLVDNLTAATKLSDLDPRSTEKSPMLRTLAIKPKLLLNSMFLVRDIHLLQPLIKP